jgi:hypothetical protein
MIKQYEDQFKTNRILNGKIKKNNNWKTQQKPKVKI